MRKVLEQVLAAHSVQAATRVIRARHSIPAQVPDVLGRTEDVTSWVPALQRGGRAAISGLQGLGCIGKTQPALKVVEQL